MDLKILANLALYHSRRIPAAVSYNLYQITGDPNALADAIDAESRAIEAWRDIVASAGDVYAPDLMMGVRNSDMAIRLRTGYSPDLDLCGHWRDELTLLEKGLVALKGERTGLPSAGSRRTPIQTHSAGEDIDPPAVVLEPVTNARAGAPIKVAAVVRDPSGVASVRLRYRGVTQFEDYQSLEMKPDGGDRYAVVIPAVHIDPKWDFMYYIEAIDKSGNGKIYPDFEKETPYIVVRLADR